MRNTPDGLWFPLVSTDQDCEWPRTGKLAPLVSKCWGWLGGWGVGVNWTKLGEINTLECVGAKTKQNASHAELGYHTHQFA